MLRTGKQACLPEKYAQHGCPFAILETSGVVFWQYSAKEILSSFRTFRSVTIKLGKILHPSFAVIQGISKLHTEL